MGLIFELGKLIIQNYDTRPIYVINHQNENEFRRKFESEGKDFRDKNIFKRMINIEDCNREYLRRT